MLFRLAGVGFVGSTFPPELGNPGLKGARVDFELPGNLDPSSARPLALD
ncbi:MAG: hypothetical protein WCB18_04535 [Thermoplasmata archaeon]